MKATSATSTPGALHVTSRVLASLLGGYAFTWGFTTLGVACAVALGMSYHDASALFSMLAFLVYPTCVGGAFVAKRLWLVWAVLAGGGALMTLAAWLLSRTLVP